MNTHNIYTLHTQCLYSYFPRVTSQQNISEMSMFVCIVSFYEKHYHIKKKYNYFSYRISSNRCRCFILCHQNCTKSSIYLNIQCFIAKRSIYSWGSIYDQFTRELVIYRPFKTVSYFQCSQNTNQCSDYHHPRLLCIDRSRCLICTHHRTFLINV